MLYKIKTRVKPVFFGSSPRSFRQRSHRTESPPSVVYLEATSSTSSSSHTTPSPRRSTTLMSASTSASTSTPVRISAEDIRTSDRQQPQQPSTSQATNSNNTLSVPPVSYGAIPRTTARAATSQTDQGESKRCFCGYYQEVTNCAIKDLVSLEFLGLNASPVAAHK